MPRFSLSFSRFDSIHASRQEVTVSSAQQLARKILGAAFQLQSEQDLGVCSMSIDRVFKLNFPSKCRTFFNQAQEPANTVLAFEFAVGKPPYKINIKSSAICMKPNKQHTTVPGAEGVAGVAGPLTIGGWKN
jgi:hypothetical protein